MPVVQRGKSVLVTAGHGAQQRRVIALRGTRPHARSRSGAPMYNLSQQQTSSVPIGPEVVAADATWMPPAMRTTSLRNVARCEIVPDPKGVSSMPVVDVVIGVGWVVFWIYWLVASIGAKTGRTRWARFAGVRVAIILVILLLLRLRVFKRHHAYAVDPWLQGIGLALFVVGLALAVWARIYIGRNWGLPMSEKADPELVTTGPYHVIRHPIYSGIILAMVGTAVAVSLYWLIAVVVLGTYFLYSAAMEERYLAGVFPDSYPGYKQSTKMLVPFIL
jgi:protein-S-isoprenylcysteine O-methyltransferase Ste14